MEVGIQGVLGSFHDQAASKYFNGHDLDLKPFSSFRSLAKAIQAKELDYGVMAIENTIAGSILPNYALISEFDLEVTGEVYIRIEMNLIAHAGVKLEDINQVFSHPMALLQCSDFLTQYPNMKLTEYEDTADSVRLIKESNMTNAAAIASKKAAQLFDMPILEENIETNKQNYTRFLIIKSRMNGQTKVPEKASLRVMTKHDPGRLSDVLVAFKEHNINLTKIQSMPVLGQPYRYAFNIDVTWEDYDEYQQSLKEIAKSSELIEIHGEYEKGLMPDYDKGSR
ncbi:prephenate dehydratase [Reichenbachiella agarivorans]|uniref:prephenate dehydratase n=1 Tax=Reichenbachiella agarivorans TaxID=2979464 RepID=A0ABY6CMB6_9BACT|nr:prephenate dehydratase [Reichenbachiella agarivorans]UXP31617.1 prephenate dehydratase [Reichenbachiella agarivorans]